jgi:DNA (cytosine-5)-methyltransferase 1
MAEKSIKIVDLFAGAGGLTAGFVMLSGHPYKPVWANDFNKYAADTYNANFGNHCIYGDIVSILQNKDHKIPKADIVIGGPPCQGFSLLNKNRENDPRKALWIPYMQIVEISEADYFVMENVPQLLNTTEHLAILEKANELGFLVWSGVLAAIDYGVPQSRRRAFIIGSKKANPADYFPPKKTHISIALKKRHNFQASEYIDDPLPIATVRDAIGDLPHPQGVEIRDEIPPLNLHFGRTPTAKSLLRYKAIPAEGMNRFDLQRNAPEITPDCWIRKTKGGTDLFGRLWWDRPAFTIRTEFYKPEKGRYLHPVQHRPITHREAARLQTFPDKFVFVGNKIEIARQIGNAVPPKLASVVADSMYQLINSRRHH